MSNILLAESHDSIDHIVVVLTESLHGSSASALSLLHDEGNIIGIQTSLIDSLLGSGLSGSSLLLLFRLRLSASSTSTTTSSTLWRRSKGTVGTHLHHVIYLLLVVSL